MVVVVAVVCCCVASIWTRVYINNIYIYIIYISQMMSNVNSGSGQLGENPGALLLNTWSDCCGMGTENFALKMMQLGVQLWLKPA